MVLFRFTGEDLCVFIETVPRFHVVIEDVLGQVVPASGLLGPAGGRLEAGLGLISSESFAADISSILSSCCL